jgi:retinol dehydrogenase 12
MTDSTPSLLGRVALITGANTGIGKVTAQKLAEWGAHVFVACRSTERAATAVDEIRGDAGSASVEALALDLGDLASVRRCAAQFLERGLPLHLLINNAGVGGGRGLTKSGFELAFGVNHVGHFLLTQLLLPRLRESAPARIVTVSSKAHYRARGIDFDAVRKRTPSPTGLPEYGVSKLANALFSAELGRKLAGSGLTTYALHPGVVASDIWRTLPWVIRPIAKAFMITTEEGALTTLYCATSEQAGRESGLYYDKARVVAPSTVAQDGVLAAKLWAQSEAWVEA